MHMRCDQKLVRLFLLHMNGALHSNVLHLLINISTCHTRFYDHWHLSICDFLTTEQKQHHVKSVRTFVNRMSKTSQQESSSTVTTSMNQGPNGCPHSGRVHGMPDLNSTPVLTHPQKYWTVKLTTFTWGSYKNEDQGRAEGACRTFSVQSSESQWAQTWTVKPVSQG